MPSTFSSNLRVELMADGEQSTTWGQKTNTNLELLEAAISEMATIATTGGTTVLTALDGADDQARKAVLKITGTLVSNATLQIPAVTKAYWVWNATSGAYTVTIKTASGSGQTVTANQLRQVFCDGTDVFNLVTSSVSGGTVDATNITASGTLNVAGVVTQSATSAGGSVTTNITNTSSAAGSQAELRVTQGTVVAVVNAYGGSTVFFGSISNHQVNFLTNNVTRAILDTSGNFGIGGAPDTILNARATTPVIRATSTGVNGVTEISLYSTGVADWRVRNNVDGAGALSFVRDTTEHLRIDGSGQVKYTDPSFAITQAQALCKFGAFTNVANGASGNAFQSISVNGTLAAGTYANFLATATPDVVCLSGWAMRGGAGSNPLVPGNIGAWFENNLHIVWSLEVDCNNEGSSNATYGDQNRGVGIMVNTGSTYSPDTGIWINRATGAGTGPGWQRGMMINGARQVGIQIEAMAPASYPGMSPAAPGTLTALLVNIIGDTQARYYLTETGLQGWGSGSAVADVTLSRSAVGTLTLAGGLVVGSATGGGKGTGTINCAADIYKNNAAYTNPDYVFEHAYTGRIDRFAANDGASDYTGLKPLSEVERITRETLRLPGMTDAAMGMFSRTDFLLEKTEEIFLHLFDHEKRLTALQSK